MKQYAAMARSPRLSWMDDERVNVPSITVCEPDDCWRETGLYDAAGVPLMSREVIGPIGFVRFGGDGRNG